MFRRIHYFGKLTWMTEEDIHAFLRGFLEKFIPDMGENQWTTWARQFMEADSPWKNNDISIDMLKQYLMRQITQASMHGDGNCVTTKSVTMKTVTNVEVSKEHVHVVINNICDHGSAREFLRAYAPV